MKSKYLLLIFLFFNFACLAKNHIISLNIQNFDGQITISPHLAFTTTEQIKEAIDNGIRIKIIAKAQLLIPNTWWIDKTLDNKKYNLEVSYFTLGQLYIVKNITTGEQLGFNEYEQVWREIESLLVFNFNTTDIAGLYAKVRLVLDKGALPTVMQLPTLLNSNWDIDTPWLLQAVESK